MIRCLFRPGVLLAILALSGCSDKQVPSYNPDIGPFDEDGNYIEDWADNPPKRGERRQVSIPTKPEPRPAPRSTPSPPKTRTAAKPKPKPAPKPKPKPKPVKVEPKFVRHTVQKGETLYRLSRRYGTTVSAIQKANGLSGTNIRIGQSLKIPK